MHLIEKVGQETRETIKEIKVTTDIYEYTKSLGNAVSKSLGGTII